MEKIWFVSHPSGSSQHTPAFFHAVNAFARQQGQLKVVIANAEAQALHQTKQAISEAALVLAEVSIPSTGSGIELGWASAYDKPIIGFYQAGAQVSPAVKFVTKQLYSYVTEEDIVDVLKTLV